MEIVQLLKVILATNFTLYLKAHNFHWNVEGPNFTEYHAYFSGFYESVYDQTDDIAENIRKLDSYAPGSLTRFLELSKISDTTEILSAMEMFETLKADNNTYIELLKEGVETADEASMPALSNYLQGILDEHQKKAWMLKSITK